LSFCDAIYNLFLQKNQTKKKNEGLIYSPLMVLRFFPNNIKLIRIIFSFWYTLIRHHILPCRSMILYVSSESGKTDHFYCNPDCLIQRYILTVFFSMLMSSIFAKKLNKQEKYKADSPSTVQRFFPAAILN